MLAWIRTAIYVSLPPACELACVVQAVCRAIRIYTQGSMLPSLSRPRVLLNVCRCVCVVCICWCAFAGVYLLLPAGPWDVFVVSKENRYGGCHTLPTVSTEQLDERTLSQYNQEQCANPIRTSSLMCLSI